MSYQVLARKWRPSTFDQMVGQEHVLKALVNALDGGRLHHAYLFTGTRGVGKTSLARLFAKSLNCERGVSASPCGECSPCRDIAQGRFVDLIEVDAASRTKVEDTRELLENVQYAPTQGRYKVYLIDEVHMLSTHSFNALLKTLEEPPPHIKFLLATTDPQKLPVTILSRCLQFNLKNMTPERVVSHLQLVLGQEQVPFDDAALWLLSRAANGSMRDALSLTDQAISFGSGELREADVRTMLGSVDPQQVYKLLGVLAQGSASGVMAAVADMAEFGADFDDVLADLLTLLHRVAIAQALPDNVDNSLGDRDAVLALAGQMRAEDLQLYYQIALSGRKDLPLVPVPRDGFEMTLLRMLAFRPVNPGELALPQAGPNQEILKQDDQPEVKAEAASPAVADSALLDPVIQQPEADLAGPVEVTDKRAGGEVVSSLNRSGPAVSADGALVDGASVDGALVDGALASAALTSSTLTHDSGVRDDEPPAAEDAPPWGESPAQSPPDNEVSIKKAEAPAEPVIKTSGVTTGSAEATSSQPFRLSALDAERWIELLDAIGLSGMTYNIAANASVASVQCNAGQPALVNFVLPGRQMHLFNDTHQQRIEDALSNFFAEQVKVTFNEGEIPAETPAQFKERRRKERLAEAITAIQGDSNVQAIVARYDGTLEINSVAPLETHPAGDGRA